LLNLDDPAAAGRPSMCLWRRMLLGQTTFLCTAD